MSEPSITCPVCGRTSHHPVDVSQGYCGNCHDWTGGTRQLDVSVNAGGIPTDGLFYDRQLHPITLGRYVHLMRDPGYKRIGYDEVAGVAVSTVWLGSDISTYGPPEVFETMMFRDGKPVSQERYTSEAEAIHTHERLVRSLEMVGPSFLDELLADEEPDDDVAALIQGRAPLVIFDEIEVFEAGE